MAEMNGGLGFFFYFFIINHIFIFFKYFQNYSCVGISYHLEINNISPKNTHISHLIWIFIWKKKKKHIHIYIITKINILNVSNLWTS